MLDMARLLSTLCVLLTCCCVYGKQKYIMDVSVKCGARLTNGPIINILTDVALTAQAVCTGGDQEFKTIDKVHYSLTGSYTGSSKACRWQKHRGIYTYTIDVHVKYGEVGSMITTKDKIKTIVCTYNEHGKDDTPSLAVNDPYIAPQELGTIVGATLPSNQFTLSIQDVHNKDVVGSLNADRKYSIYAKYIGSVRGSSLKPVSCDAVAGNGVRYAVLRAGCGDGLVFTKDAGFDVSYMSFRSPYFEGFHLQKNHFLSFECKVVLCSGRCDGSTCSRMCAARPTYTVTNGKLSKCVGLKYKNTCSYTCNTGYTQVGNGIATCGPDGLWTKPSITCTARSCGSAPVVLNSARHSPSKAVYLGRITYTCSSGYVFYRKINYAICLSTGKFSTTPQCRPKSCGAAPVVRNSARRSASSAAYKGRVTYTCKPGYVFSKTNYAYCYSSGKYSTTPQCTPRSCGSAPVVANSARHSPSKAVYLGRVTYTCKSGYLFHKSINNAYCSSSGKYSATPQCRPRTCGAAPKVANSARRSASSTVFPKRITYACKLGYVFSPRSRNSIVCGSTGKYSTTPKCARSCGAAPVVRHSARRSASSATYTERVTYTCKPGYLFSSTNYVYCFSSGRYSATPQCKRLCPTPASINNGTFKVTGKFAGAKVIYKCNAFYGLKGGSTHTCLSSGKWSGKPSCRLFGFGK